MAAFTSSIPATAVSAFVVRWEPQLNNSLWAVDPLQDSSHLAFANGIIAINRL